MICPSAVDIERVILNVARSPPGQPIGGSRPSRAAGATPSRPTLILLAELVLFLVQPPASRGHRRTACRRARYSIVDRLAGTERRRSAADPRSVGSRPGDRDDPVARLDPGACGRAARLTAPTTAACAASPEAAKKGAKIAIASRKLATGPASTIRNRCHHGLEVEGSARTLRRHMARVGWLLAGFMSPTKRT